jgi:hypothetical protein
MWRLKMKKIFRTIVGLAAIGAFVSPVSAQDTKTTLTVRAKIFEAVLEHPGAEASKTVPEIVLFSALEPVGNAKTESQIELLKKYFGLGGIKALDTPPEIELSWVSWEEKRKNRPEAVHIVTLNGVEYRITLSPQEIDPAKKRYEFVLAVDRLAPQNSSSTLQFAENVFRRTLLWEFHGPAYIGFRFADKLYFVSYVLGLSRSFQAGSLGGGISWIL